MPQAAKTVFQEAESLFRDGCYAEALRRYVAVVEGVPRFTKARGRVADALLNLGDRAHAKAVYRSLAWHYIKAGQPLLALVACKMVLALDPSASDMLRILAEMYSSESDRVAEIDLEPPFVLADDHEAGDIATLDGSELCDRAAKVAEDTESIAMLPAQIPLIPLFSHLTEEAFIRVIGSLRLRRHTSGERIVLEGDPGDSFFMLADGTVVVSKRLNGVDTVLAHLDQGAVFGEMALVSSARRAATVSAMGDVDLLELSRHDIEGYAGELESVQQALKKFTRARFLANLAATSPLFRPLSRPDRRALMGRFKSRKVHPGDVIIAQGEPGRALFLVLRGEFHVARVERDASNQVAVLKGGDVFGEISLLHDTPTTATVTAASTGELLHLAREDFDEMLKDHPEVRMSLGTLSEERLRQLRAQASPALITSDAEIML